MANLISVPSCNAHNNNQSKADEYLKFILTATTANPSEEVIDSTVRSIVRLLKRGSRSLNRFGIDSNGDEVEIGSDAPVDDALLLECLEKIARGIYHHHHGLKKKLLGRLIVYPIFLGTDPTATEEQYDRFTKLSIMTHQDLNQGPILGEHPNIFGYQIIEDAELTTVNMVFFGDRLVSIMCEKAVV